MIYIIAFFIPLIYVFLKVFQNRNINTGELGWVFITSYGITAFEIASITLVVSKGWDVYLPLATGGAVGAILAIKLHAKLRSSKC